MTKLERLIVKIGVFSILYIVPSVCVLACNAYHAVTLYRWERYTRLCYDQALCEDRPERPSVEIYMLQLFMALAPGITSGLWIASCKSCRIYRVSDCKRIDEYLNDRIAFSLVCSAAARRCP